MLQNEIKDSAFEAYLLTKENQFLTAAVGSWKITCARSYMCVVLELLSNGGLNCFSQHVLPKLGKITATCPKSVKRAK